MSPTAPVDAIPAGSHTKITDEQTSLMADKEVMEQGEAHERSFDNDDNEDPATQAASENLKHASISEKEPQESLESSAMEGEDSSDVKKLEEPGRPITPEQAEPSDAHDEEMKERITSPKKKRGRDQDDEARDLEAAGNTEEVGISPNGNAVNGGRTTRLAPEKKRYRDASVETVVPPETGTDIKSTLVTEDTAVIETAASTSNPSTKSLDAPPPPLFDSSARDISQTSASAFTSSGFGSLAGSSTSGFAALAASKPSVFGSGTTPSVSGFGALAGSSSVIPETSSVKLGFGGSTTEPLSSTLGSGFGSTSTTGFGAIGSAFGGGFSGFTGGSGPKLSSFATSSTPVIIGSEKPVKAFGAPESDEEEDSEEDDESKGGVASDEDESISVDEKKKHRVSRVPINDGEEGEATLLQLRAKLFTFVKGTGWKERGAGNLKLNVPRSYVDYDENGIPILGTFDPSARDDSDEEGGESGPTSARLIMRQDNTHRVILNTVILKGIKFEEKSSTSGAPQIMFTAFEEAHPVNMLLRMNEANAKLFTSEIHSIQQEL